MVLFACFFVQSAGAALHHAVVPEHSRNGAEEASHIQTKAQMLHIPAVQLCFLRDLQFIAAKMCIRDSPGGLTSSTEIRLLLCYLVKNAGPIARQEIENALMVEALVKMCIRDSPYSTQGTPSFSVSPVKHRQLGFCSAWAST